MTDLDENENDDNDNTNLLTSIQPPHNAVLEPPNPLSHAPHLSPQPLLLLLSGHPY